MRYSLLILLIAALACTGGCAESGVEICGGGCPPGQICDYETNRCVDARPDECPEDVGRFLSTAVDSENNIVFSSYTRKYGDLLVGKIDPAGQVSCEYVDGMPVDGGALNDANPYLLGDDVGLYSSLALDLFDRPHVAYFDRTNEKLRYAHKGAEGWEVVSVPHTPGATDVFGRACSLALDSDGLPHIAFFNETAGSLEITRKLSSGRWTLERIPLDHQGESPGSLGGEVGRLISLVLDSNDREWISFRDVHDGVLKVAGHQAGVWSVLEVDSGSDLGTWVSSSIDAEGNTAIAYHDRRTGALMYAYNSEGVLKKIVADDGIYHTEDGAIRQHSVGQHCSLAFGVDDLPRIVYLDAAMLDLKMVVGRREGGFEPPEVVDSMGSVGFFNTLKPGIQELHATSCRLARSPQGEVLGEIVHHRLSAGSRRLGGGS